MVSEFFSILGLDPSGVSAAEFNKSELSSSALQPIRTADFRKLYWHFFLKKFLIFMKRFCFLTFRYWILKTNIFLN